MVDELAPGDVLSYSAGSTQIGPEGYRKLGRRGGDPLAAYARRWPDIPAIVGWNTPIFINAYPANVGAFPSGVTIDTYLSPRVFSRALLLAATRGHPAVLVGQPLFLADALLRHLDAGRALPESLALFVGGYALQRSLEEALRALLEARLPRGLLVLQLFGAAEVDAGCLAGRERDADGEVVFHARPDVTPELDGDELLLTIRGPEGAPIVERFRTGDRARRAGEGWVLGNPRRYHPAVAAELESWDADAWRRRTGYVQREDGAIWIQLREGEGPREPREVGHFAFAERFGFSWLRKPVWR